MVALQRSIFYSAVERYGTLALFFVMTAVLSRLLSPTEFGIYALVNAIAVVTAAAFQEFGGANYLIQKEDLSLTSTRSAFTVILLTCVTVAAILYVLADPLARFFGQAGVQAGIKTSALNFLLAPFSGTLSALHRRKMEFGTLAVCNLAGNAMNGVVSIILALASFSYMAPIWGGVAGHLALTAMLVYKQRDMSVFRLSIAEFRDVVGFGLYSAGVSVINIFYNLSPQIFMARILDFASVGLYSRAANITQIFDKMILQVLNPVILPAIAARRNGRESLRGDYLMAAQMLAVVQWPAMAFVALMSPSIILIWLGGAWLDIVPLVRMLCLANMVLFAACLSYPVLVAVNSVRDALVSSLISLPPSLLVIFGASFFGVKAVAASALLTLPFQAGVALYYISRHLDFGPRDFLNALMKSAAVTGITAGAVAICAVLVEVGTIGPVLGLAAGCVLAAASWWLGLAITAHPMLSRLQETISQLAAVAVRLRPSRSTP